MISEMYDLLMSFSSKSSVSKLIAWKTDLHKEITMEQWMKACELAQTQGNTHLKQLANDTLFFT